MSVQKRGLRTGVALHLGGAVEAWVQPLAEWDRVVVHLDHGATLHFDRDGLALLGTLLEQARADLDAAQDEMAAAIETTISTATPDAAPNLHAALFLPDIGHVGAKPEGAGDRA